MPDWGKGRVTVLRRRGRLVLERQNSGSVDVQDLGETLPVELLRRRGRFGALAFRGGAGEHGAGEIEIHGRSIRYEPVQLKLRGGN